MRAQAEIERQLQQRLEQVQRRETSDEQAFGLMDDWVVQLCERRAVLQPKLKQWLWYDRLHKEWIFAGCGVGEAILLTVGKVGGVKKLPQPGFVDDWCIYRQGETFHEPLRIEELRTQLDSQKVPGDILIWSTQATDWFTPADEIARQIIYAKQARDRR